MAHVTDTTTPTAASAHAQADDIQVGFVAIMTVLFAAFLLVSLIGLEAFFHNAASAEAKAKTADQGSPKTELGAARAQWNTMLHANGNVPNVVAAGKEDAAGKVVYPTVTVVPIGAAMDDVVKQYGSAPSTKGSAGGVQKP